MRTHTPQKGPFRRGSVRPPDRNSPGEPDAGLERRQPELNASTIKDLPHLGLGGHGIAKSPRSNPNCEPTHPCQFRVTSVIELGIGVILRAIELDTDQLLDECDVQIDRSCGQLHRILQAGCRQGRIREDVEVAKDLQLTAASLAEEIQNRQKACPALEVRYATGLMKQAVQESLGAGRLRLSRTIDDHRYC